MSRLLSDWPIQRKLSAIVLGTSGLLITLIAITLTVERYVSFRKNLEEHTSVLAEVVATNSTAALAFQDQLAGQEILETLQAEKDVVAACLFNSEGTSFAFYLNTVYLDVASQESSICSLNKFYELIKVHREQRFSKDFFDVAHPVYLNKKIIGHLVVRLDFEAFKRRIVSFIAAMFGLGVLLLLVAYFICRRLNTIIVGPITELVHAMDEMSGKQDYTLRVSKHYSDEVGLLIDGFNEMVGKIQVRDQQITEHQHHLQKLVQKRTEELQTTNTKMIQEIKERKAAENQLAHAQKMKAIGTLAGGVAHDLNNILSGVVSYPELLLMDLPEDSKLRVPLETIYASGKKATAIVQDLLTLARRGVKVEESVNLQKLVEEYIASPECLELLALHPEVEIDLRVYHDSSGITGSPFHLTKMVMNLVSNAAEAIPEKGTIVVTIDRILLTESPQGLRDQKWEKGEYVLLTIADTGEGIPEKYQDRIFEPFYSKKEMGRSGTGLGMAVVWGTIEDHSGVITLSSQENVGTTFRIYFPSSGREEFEVSEVKTDQPIYGEGQSILLVDDSMQQREIATAVLERLGYSTTAVASGEAAVEYLKKHDVDLVILDMIMNPGIDGLETYKKIITFKPHQKTIIASGFSGSGKVRRARELGVDEYVRKPYSMNRISKAIRNALNSR